MKKQIIFTLFLLIFIFSCSKTPTDPNTNNTNPSKVFNNNFQFGGFGNVSKILIEDNNNINMTLDKTILYIDKSMVIKFLIQNIKYYAMLLLPVSVIME